MKTWTKICGIKTREALDAAIEGGADFVGFVFFERSPRNVTLDEAAALAAHARGRAIVVALVVDADDAALDEIVARVAPNVFQLHGRESPERLAAIRYRLGGRVWKAVPVETAADALQAIDFAHAADDWVIFDAKAPKGAALPGGNGHVFDWSALDAVDFPFMLSGGLNADNVADAIATTGASAVDVSSGVESAPGVKDPGLIRRFLEAVKGSAAG